MNIKLIFAIFVGKTITYLLKTIGRGATTAPGLYALKIDPKLIEKLSKQIKYGSVLITGTNGKTTTARLTYDILSTKFKIIHNRQGSNLLRGIASTLLQQASLSGNLKSDLAIWEVDEATFPEAVRVVHPKIVTLLNLMRDQLDRYGEVDSLRIKWQEAISKLPSKTTLILNTDDPGVSFLANSHNGKTIFFGINTTKINLPQITNVADIKHCLNCHSKLSYSNLLTAHMGHYFCPNCKLKRPSPQISAQNLQFKPDFSTRIDLSLNSPRPRQATRGGQLSTFNYNLPGLYNAYNVLGACAIANALSIQPKEIKKSIENFSAAFGRFQKIKIGKKQVIIFLIKNPAGANEVLRTIAQREKLDVLAILNDNIADGRDVSWIWDTDWEVLTPKINYIAVSGTRAWDLATRLKYAGIKLSNKDVYKKINYSIIQNLKKLDTKNTLLILPTYTALLDVQKTLSKRGATIKWQQQ
jgi:UDP-N-acetylmuramyl tripeptide synthase